MEPIEKLNAPCKVKILKSSKEQSWYRNRIGEVFETTSAPNGKNFILWQDFTNKNAVTWRHIQPEDCEIIV